MTNKQIKKRHVHKGHVAKIKRRMYKFLKNFFIFQVIFDIVNYIYFIRSVRKLQKHPEWSKLKFRTGWFYQFGVIVKLHHESWDNNPSIQNTYSIEASKKYNIWLFDQNPQLTELIVPTWKKINKSQYLITYWYLPDARYFYWVNLLKIAILIYVIFNWGYIFGLATTLVAKIYSILSWFGLLS